MHRGKSLATLALQLGDLLSIPLDVRIHLGQQFGLDVLEHTADARSSKSDYHNTQQQQIISDEKWQQEGKKKALNTLRKDTSVQ